MDISNAPVSWGVDRMDRVGLPDWRRVFEEIHTAGYTFAEIGPIGYVPDDIEVVREKLNELDLKATGAPLLAPIFDPARRGEVLTMTHKLARLVAGVGGDVIVLVDWALVVRGDTAGRSDSAPRMNKEQAKQYADAYNEIGAVTQTYGLTAAAHPHAGTFLEFQDEVDILLDTTDRSLVTLCVDTGHVAYGGMDPSALVRQYGDRLSYVNFKDLGREVHRKVIDERIDFLSAVDRGVFTAVGAGCVDFDDFRRALDEVGFQGRGCVEQDRDVMTVDAALTDARMSLEFLRKSGF